MGVNPQKAIVVHHIIQVLGVIVCVSVAVSINYLLFYCLLSANIAILMFIIFWTASKCKCQDLIVILVHFNTILSTLWFITVFPGFVLSFVMIINFDTFTYYYSDTLDARVLVVAVITGFMSINSATYAVLGIWKSARDVVLRARSGERDLDYGVVHVPQQHEAPATCTDRNDHCNDMKVAQDHCDEPMLTL